MALLLLAVLVLSPLNSLAAPPALSRGLGLEKLPLPREPPLPALKEPLACGQVVLLPGMLLLLLLPLLLLRPPLPLARSLGPPHLTELLQSLVPSKGPTMHPPGPALRVSFPMESTSPTLASPAKPAKGEATAAVRRVPLCLPAAEEEEVWLQVCCWPGRS